MTTFAGTQQEEAAAHMVDSHENGNNSEHETWLRPSTGGALANPGEVPREWLFPGSDELFRSIYTRAGTGFASDVLAVCSRRG
jgi:hypothetical protein